MLEGQETGNVKHWGREMTRTEVRTGEYVVCRWSKRWGPPTALRRPALWQILWLCPHPAAPPWSSAEPVCSSPSCLGATLHPAFPNCSEIWENEGSHKAYWAGRRSPLRSSSADTPPEPEGGEMKHNTHCLTLSGVCSGTFGENRTFSSGQCVLSLRKGSRFGRSNSA